MMLRYVYICTRKMYSMKYLNNVTSMIFYNAKFWNLIEISWTLFNISFIINKLNVILSMQ